jgi:hypothetical protein
VKGAEGANPEEIRTKLSGKRTVSSFKSWKDPNLKLDTEEENPNF